MPVTSTCTAPGSAASKRWLAQTLLPIRFNPMKRIAVSIVHTTSSLVLPCEYATGGDEGVSRYFHDDVSQRQLCRHEHDAHDDECERELAVDPVQRPQMRRLATTTSWRRKNTC